MATAAQTKAATPDASAAPDTSDFLGTPESEEETAPAKTVQAPGESGEYVVLSSAMTATIGRIEYGLKKGEPIVKRFFRGQIAKLDAEFTDIANLLRLKAIAVNDGEDKKATTATIAAKAAGAVDDPALPASDEFAALNAPAQVEPAGETTTGQDTSTSSQ